MSVTAHRGDAKSELCLFVKIIVDGAKPADLARRAAHPNRIVDQLNPAKELHVSSSGLMPTFQDWLTESAVAENLLWVKAERLTASIYTYVMSR